MGGLLMMLARFQLKNRTGCNPVTHAMVEPRRRPLIVLPLGTMAAVEKTGECDWRPYV